MPITSATSTYTICTLHTLLIYISQDLGTGEDDVSFLNHHFSSLCSCLSNSESGLTLMSSVQLFHCSLSGMFTDSMKPMKSSVVQGSCLGLCTIPTSPGRPSAVSRSSVLLTLLTLGRKHWCLLGSQMESSGLARS